MFIKDIEENVNMEKEQLGNLGCNRFYSDFFFAFGCAC